MLDMMEERLCVGCGDPSAKFVEDWHEGTTICTNCGTVDPIRLIDPTLEKRKFSDSDGADPERTEEVDRFIGIQTNFSFAKNEFGEFDANLSGLSSALRKQRKLSYKETKIQSGLSDINSMCTRLALPKRVQARARDLFAIWEENRPKFSRSGEMAIVLAIIFKACKIENNTRSFKELSAATGVPANSISKFYKRLEKTLNSGSKIQIHTSKSKPFSTASDEVIDQVTRITGKMSLPYSFTVQTNDLARSAANLLEGKHPNSIAAACIYYNAQQQKLPLSEKDLAAHAGLAVATMKGAWKTLQETLAAAPLVSITTGQVVLANLSSPVEDGDDEDVSLSDRPSPDLER